MKFDCALNDMIISTIMYENVVLLLNKSCAIILALNIIKNIKSNMSLIINQVKILK